MRRAAAVLALLLADASAQSCNIDSEMGGIAASCCGVNLVRRALRALFSTARPHRASPQLSRLEAAALTLNAPLLRRTAAATARCRTTGAPAPSPALAAPRWT